jgi:hypothetical protein
VQAYIQDARWKVRASVAGRRAGAVAAVSDRRANAGAAVSDRRARIAWKPEAQAEGIRVAPPDTDPYSLGSRLGLPGTRHGPRWSRVPPGRAEAPPAEPA